MKRLTKKDGGGYSLNHDNCPKQGDCYDSADCVSVLVDRLAAYEEAEEKGLLLMLPCKIGDTVYRICPKCNDRHDGSCEHCAWQYTGGITGCTVFGLWSDGQYPAEKCTVVPWHVGWNNMPVVIEKLGQRIFLTREEAEERLAELHEREEKERAD